jgi:hypothetical protein
MISIAPCFDRARLAPLRMQVVLELSGPRPDVLLRAACCLIISAAGAARSARTTGQALLAGISSHREDNTPGGEVQVTVDRALRV